jgi:sec-independent protein translocase protein TatB
MRDDLSAELGPEIADLDLKSLNPRSLVEKHLLGDDDEPTPQAPSPAVRSEIPLTKPTRPAARPDHTPYDDDAT